MKLPDVFPSSMTAPDKQTLKKREWTHTFIYVKITYNKTIVLERSDTMNQHCSQCGQPITDPSTKFCPNCGAVYVKPKGWFCSNCGTKNEDGTNFCKECGTPRVAPQSEPKPSRVREIFETVVHYRYFKYILAAVLVMLVGAGGSFYYFTNMNEDHYLKYYAAASRSLNNANELVLSNTKSDVLTSENAADLKKQLQGQKDEIDRHAKEFSSRKPFKGYGAQHQATLEMLQKESTVLDTTMQVIEKPLDTDLDTQVEDMKDITQSIRDLSNQIEVPNTSMTLDSDPTILPQQLATYTAAQRKQEEERKRIEAERAAHQAEINEFFSKMDSAIDRYNNAKADLGGMMESSRNGGMLWSDYFNIIDNARGSRMGVKYEVERIKTPAGTENLKGEFLATLNDAVRYCNIMRIGANLAFHDYYAESYQKTQEAEKLDEQVQKEYGKFIKHYQSLKAQMTGN